jgi:hypothetical protein
MKSFQVIYKFSDVIDTIDAESEDEAQRISDERVNSGHLEYDPKTDTECYEVEVEEVKDG